MRKAIISTMILLFTLSPQSSGQPAGGKSHDEIKAEQAVLKQVDNWIDALKKSDMAALDQIMADDFMLTASDGKILSKEQDLAPVKSADVRFESINIEGVRVFIYGDTAVVTGIGKYRVNYKGRASDISERFFDVYQKRNGRWQVVASRPTPAR